MYNSLVEFIQKHSVLPLSQEDIHLIRTLFVPKRIRKRQYFLQADEACKFSAFIVKGAMKQYSVDDKGIEHIVALYLENWWVTDRNSFTMRTPSLYNIDALEDTDLLLISKVDAMELMNIPAFNEMARVLDERHAISAQKRINSFISHSAEEKYVDLLRSYPEFLQRFPQHMIASYLGITKETLSRIRNQIVKK